MSENIRLAIDTDAFEQDLARIREEFEQLVAEDLNPLADELTTTFERAGKAIADAMSDAATTGKLSLKGLVDTVLTDLTRVAADQFVRRPLEGIFNDIFAGARAGGGPVTSRSAYLVGERGPEMFVPRAAGHVRPMAGPMTVNINMRGGDGAAGGLNRSRSQLAAGVQRGLARALRNG
jgi:phage-related minor tail protein